MASLLSETTPTTGLLPYSIVKIHIFMARSPLGGIGVKDVGRDFAPHKKNLQYQS